MPTPFSARHSPYAAGLDWRISFNQNGDPWTTRYALVRVENPQDIVAWDSTAMQFRSDSMSSIQIVRWQRLKTAGWIRKPQMNVMATKSKGTSGGVVSNSMNALKIMMLPAHVSGSPTVVSLLVVKTRTAMKNERTQSLKIVPARSL